MNKYGARKFNSKSYDKNDQWAKNLLINYLLNKGYQIIKSVEDYNHDIEALNETGEKVFFEVEVKTGYPFKGKKSFPFDTVSFTGRKKRIHEIKEFIYIIICKETKWAVACSSSIIYNQNYLEEWYINSSQRSGSDVFYRVSKELCKFFKLNR